MKLILSLVIFCLINHLSFSQKNIMGKVISSNKSPLKKVHIYFKNSSIGTISNDDGNFILKLDSTINSMHDSIVFSAIGYETKTYHKKELIGKPKFIKLALFVNSLEEISIFPFSPEELITKTIRNLETKYSFSPSTGVYKNATIINKKLNRLLILEASLTRKKKGVKLAQINNKGFKKRVSIYWNDKNNKKEIPMTLKNIESKTFFNYLVNPKKILIKILEKIKKNNSRIDISMEQESFENKKIIFLNIIQYRTENKKNKKYSYEVYIDYKNFALLKLKKVNNYSDSKWYENTVRNYSFKYKYSLITEEFSYKTKNNKYILSNFERTSFTTFIIGLDKIYKTLDATFFSNFSSNNFNSVSNKNKLNLNKDFYSQIKKTKNLDLNYFNLTQKEKDFLLSE